MASFLLIFLVCFPMGMGVVCYIIGRHHRDVQDHYVVATAAVELAAALLLLFVQGRELTLGGICGFGISLSPDGFHGLLAILASFLWLMTALPSREYFAESDSRTRYYLFYLLTLGALMGVFLSNDLFTTFLFFEMMSFTSYVWVVQNETREAIRASDTYLAVAVIGGMTLLMGLFLLQDLFGTLRIEALGTLVTGLPEGKLGQLYAAGGCCLFGFGAKAGMFPMHIWLPKAHPVAPAPASALLSGILTKSGIYGILVISCNLFLYDVPWGKLILLLGVITMLGGAVLAVFSIDLKRTLACSSMSQIGFILLGVGMQVLLNEENALAAAGTVLHLVNHSLIKLVLFVAAGVVYRGTHSLNLNVVRGFANDRPALATAFTIGALSICGVPMFSGYVSKTLLHESIVEYMHLLAAEGLSTAALQAVEVLFLLTGGLTVAYMTKLFAALCIDPKMPGHHVPPAQYMDHSTAAAMGVGALALVGMGMTPALTMERLARFSQGFLRAAPLEGHVHYFAWVNLKGALISLGIGLCVYFLFVRTCLMKRGHNGEWVYLDRWPRWLDIEEAIYRPALDAASFLGAMAARTLASAGDTVLEMGRRVLFLKAPGIIVPKGNEEFGTYAKEPRKHTVLKTFSFDLLLAGLGLVAALLYILIRT
ncbi:sodium:proton antiporter [Oscillibacter hominis]|uniref:Sodium:proton antiporter n=1 Tax=Oscillibacter hominis TaxID=2763056 RepID=A0A7G9B2E6_9FIRM|nr:proton-conducting transporter membrane subunit [Oscillibacter hominis]QNL43727.1 sodium:proton antiporter [Oscillibacter hominis]